MSKSRRLGKSEKSKARYYGCFHCSFHRSRQHRILSGKVQQPMLQHAGQRGQCVPTGRAKAAKLHLPHPTSGGGFCPTQLFLQVPQVWLALQHIQGFLPRRLLTRTVMMVTQTHRNQNDEENSQKEHYKKSCRA